MLGRWLAVVMASVVGAAAACGGESTHRSGDDGGSGGRGATTGGTGAGGGGGGGALGGTAGRGGSSAGRAGSAPGSGGSGVSGRQNQAGLGGGTSGVGGAASGAGGATSGAGGASGAGGSVDRCATPPLLPCDHDGPTFYHDDSSNECATGVGTQCGPFASLAECMATCPGSKPAIAACDTSAECVIVDPGCCGHCDPVSSTDLLGANRVRAEDARNCPGGVACGACPTISELERTRQNFFVSCGYGTCRILDVRETNATYCTTDDDCHLRLGAGCCEACNGPGLIAVANTDYLDSTVCRDVSCDDCVPQIPAGFRAACGNPDFSEHQCGVLATSGGRANAN